MIDHIIMSKTLKDPNFLGSHDLVTSVEGDQPVYGELTLTVRDMVLQEVNDMELIRTGKRNNSGKQTKLAWCMYFVEPVKPYIVKADVVIKAIEKATGTQVVNKWIGKKITFYVEKGVKAFGNITDALRVRPYAPKERMTYICADCGAEGVPEKIAVRSQSVFDAVLCKDCGIKRKEQMDAEQNFDHGQADS